MPFTCSICGEEATQICARCTKDVCSNHLCEKCLKCSDCCECEVVLREPAPPLRAGTTVHAEPPAEPDPGETSPETAEPS
jgi:hypothetical protein